METKRQLKLLDRASIDFLREEERLITTHEIAEHFEVLAQQRKVDRLNERINGKH